jgi:WD40 repeat protein
LSLDSSDGSYAAVGTGDGKIMIWNATTGALATSLDAGWYVTARNRMALSLSLRCVLCGPLYVQ